MFRKIIKILMPAILIVANKISLIGYVLPKKKNLIICGAMAGNYYGDNSRYVFEYINTNRQDLKCIWITRDRKIVRKLSVLGWPVCYSYSFKAIFLLFRAN